MTAPFKKIRTWRERIGQTADFPLHVPTDVERAMVAEIAELRALAPACASAASVAAPLAPYAQAANMITLTGHQLVAALDLIAPGMPRDADELDNDLTFGVRQHKDDYGVVANGMCCWNDDTDGVLPLDMYPGDPAIQQEESEAGNG